MNGNIGVQSNLGYGSSFWFLLNLKNAPEQTLENKTKQKSIRVLICDNLISKNTATLNYLKENNIDILFPDNQKQITEIIRTHKIKNQKIDIIIISEIHSTYKAIDIGIDFKEKKLLNETKLILTTEHGKKGDAHTYFKTGYSGYLAEPISKNLLLLAIQTLISNKSSCRDQILTKYSLFEEIELKEKTKNELVPQNQDKATILIVDDNRVNLMVAQNMLKKENYNIFLANNGLEAFNQTKNYSIDLILMDCHMPVLDGFNASIKINAEIPNPPFIIALTADISNDIIEKCQCSGMKNYISKPYKKQDLIEMINTTLTPHE